MVQPKIHKDCDLDAIKHSGIIKEIDTEHYFVSIIAQSACAACHANSICNVSDFQHEIVEVPRKKNDQFKVGDQVEILMEKSLGPKAVLLGYFIPFLMVLSTLIISLSIIPNEGIAGLISVVVLVPYYLVLYIVRDRLKTAFRFRIR
jgi:sigma-E factor negative regulatory protein RseC